MDDRFRLLVRSCLLVLSVLCAALPLSAADLQWRRWDGELTASATLGPNPYRDVIVRVEFTRTTDGETFTQDAFWQANPNAPRKFRVRAALPPGEWNWQVVGCSGHVNCGSVTWTPSNGVINVSAVTSSGIKLYDRGHPTQLTSTSTQGTTKSQLLYADFSNFFWAADTAWTAPPREISGQAAAWVSYLDNRKSRQFSVVLVAPAVAWQAAGADAWPSLPKVDSPHRAFNQSGTCSGAIPNDCSAPRREYWDAFDNLVQQANERDLLVGIVGMIDPVNITAPATTGFPNLENARDFARYLTARLAGNAVIFSPGFDLRVTNTTSQGTTLKDVMNAVGTAIRDASGGQKLITNHLAGSSSCADYAEFRNSAWMTFYLFQSGHGAGEGGAPPCPGRQGSETPLRASIRRAREMPLQLVTYTNPRLPSLNGEGPYDDFPSTAEPNNAYRLRQAGYMSTLSGAGGFTYGAFKTVFWYGPPSSFFGIASVSQMQVLFNRFRNRGAFTATHDWIVDQTVDPNHENKKVLARATTGQFLMAYVPQDPDRITISTSALSGLDCGPTWTKRWYDARNATVITVRQQDCIGGTGAITVLERPCTSGDCDFVLELERTGSGLASPGTGVASEALAAWSELDPKDGTSAVYAALLSLDGTEGDPILVSPAGLAYQNAPRVARASDGFWMVWQAENLDGSLLGVFGCRLTAEGEPAGEIFQVNTNQEQDQRDPMVASNTQGNLFVTWSSFGQDGDLGGVYARTFNPDEGAVTVELQIHQDVRGLQSLPQVVVDSLDNWVVAWESDRSLESSGNALVARIFRRDGEPLTDEIRVGADESLARRLVDLVAEGTGGFALRWTEGEESEGSEPVQWRQRFDSNGALIGAPEMVAQ